MIRTVKLHGTTDGTDGTAGAATILAPLSLTGLLHAVEWTDGDLANGVDAVLSLVRGDGAADVTLLTLTNADDDAIYYPRGEVNDGTATVDYPRMFVNGILKLAITSGGNGKSGGATVYIEV
jgi:hypothetical protein